MSAEKKYPRPDEAGGTPKTQSLARTAATNQEASVRMLPVTGDTATVSAGRVRRGRAPIASASLYEPAGLRTQWWLSIRCPHCGSVHLGRVRAEEDAPGRRRAGCGRRVTVVVRRVYRGNASKASKRVAA